MVLETRLFMVRAEIHQLTFLVLSESQALTILTYFWRQNFSYVEYSEFY